MSNKIYIPEIDITLDLLDEKKSRDNTYEIKSNLSEKEFYAFRAFVIQQMYSGKYFECEILEESKEVRFGIISHKKAEGGYFVDGPIVEKTYDEQEDNVRFGNDFNVNIEKQVLKTKIVNDRLIEFLVDKGIMSAEEKTKILDVSRKEILGKFFDYNTL